MPGRIFTPQERKRLDAFPSEIGEADLTRYFTLSGSDLDLVRQQRGDHNRLGFALQLCALRYMGFSPDGLEIVPTMAVAFVAEQLHASPAALRDYGARSQTRTEHLGVDPTVVSPGAIWWRDSRGYCLDCLMNSTRLKRRADQSSSIATWRTLSNPA